MPKRWLPENVTSYADRHGKTRYRFRKAGYKTHSFTAMPGTEAFREEYAAACQQETGVRSAGIRHVVAGTFDELIGLYYQTSDFRGLSPWSQTTYRGIYERWRATTTKSGRRYGSAFVRDLTAAHVEQMMADMLPARAAANTLRKRLGTLMKLAVKRGIASTNPVRDSSPIAGKTTGFHTWTEDEIAAYQAQHPLGSTARLTLELMLWTGQRISDARVMGPPSIRGKRLVVDQKKLQGKVVLSLPIMPALAESILATPTRGLVFILNEYGAPFTEKGLGNKMRQWCDEAGLPHCTAHGLRKAAARRFAEAGCSNQQIKSWTGHTTDSEVARYTAAVSQQAMSDAAADMLLANLQTRLGEPEANAL